jgi:hypothetical protein
MKRCHVVGADSMPTSPSVDRINWILAKMIDINGKVLVVSKEDASSGAMRKGNQLLQRRSASSLLRDNNYKKRMRSEVSTSRENDAGAASENPNERLISRLLNRQRAETSDIPPLRSAFRDARGEGGVSGSIEGFSSAADALARGALSICDWDDRGK